MKKLLLVYIAIVTGCSGGGGSGGGASTAPPVGDVPTTPVALPLPTDTFVNPDIGVAGVNPNQISFSQISAPIIYRRTGDGNTYFPFTVNNPSGKPLKCNWWYELPEQWDPYWAGTPRQTVGTVNGGCSLAESPSFNNSQLDKTMWVYVSNGETSISYRWDTLYVFTAPNQPVGIVSSTTATATAGAYRVFDTKQFDVFVDDKDYDGACTWKLDGVLMSTSCTGYKYTQSGNITKTLVFRIADATTSAQVSWTIEPEARIVVQPFVTAGQPLVATMLDPHGTGAICSWVIGYNYSGFDGACSLTWTASGTWPIKITPRYPNAYGTSVYGTSVYATIIPPFNNTVAITGYTPLTQVNYYPKNSNTVEFKITSWNDIDGDAKLDWYVGGVKTDCDVSALCDYTNAQRTGIILLNLQQWTPIWAILADGQYTSKVSWSANIDKATIDGNQPAWDVCNRPTKTVGTFPYNIASFLVHGTNFEMTDTWKTDTGEELRVLRVTGFFPEATIAELQLVAYNPGLLHSRRLIVTKPSGISTYTPNGFGSFVAFETFPCTF